MCPDRAAAPPSGWVLALVLLMAASLGVRALGLDFGIPVWEEPDALIAMHVDQLRSGAERADVRWSDQNYPHLIAKLVRPFPDRPPRQGPGAPRTTAEHLAAAAHTHLQVRWAVAWLSLLAIPGTWWLARRFAEPPAAFAAAACAATSLLLLSFSQQGRPHAAAGGLFVLSVVASMQLARRGATGDHLLAGAAAAAALGVLQTGVFVLPPLFLAFVTRPGARGARRLLDPRALIHLGLLAGSLRWFYPFLFGGQLGEDFGRPEVDGERITLAEHSVALSEFLDGGGFRVLLQSLWNYDPVLLVAAALAAAWWCLGRPFPPRPAPAGGTAGPGTRRAELAVALSFVLPYLLVLGMFAKTYERFAIPALPFLAAAVGAALQRLGAGRGPRARRGLALAAALVLAVPAAACLKLAWLRSRPDTLDQAAAWIEAHLDPADPLALPAVPRLNTSFDLPLLRRTEELRSPDGKRIKQHSPWTRYQASELPLESGSAQTGPGWSVRWLVPRDPVENKLLARDYEAFILSMAPAHYVIEPFEERFDHALFVELHRILAAQGELVARFTPEGPRGKIEWPFFYMLSDHFNDGGHEAWPHFIPRLFRARAIGPAVEIYRVDRRP